MTNPIFNPPLYIQRYQFVIDFVKKNKPKKVVDLGCNDCTLLKKLKFHREIELLAGVDIDCAVMRDKMYALAPMPTDYLQPGEDPLTIEVYQGSVTERDPRTKGFDLVTSIELIEHLQLDDVARFSEVVFGYMAPAAAIISTPNADFNPLLPGLTGFRHYDHKFEWTRTEFQTWALQVCREFGYVVEFTGVGEAPGHQEESVGFCSQIGVFHRDRTADEACLESDGTEDAFPYRLLYDVVYPSMRDSNIRQSAVVNEVLYWAEHLRREWLEETAGEGEERRGRQEETAGEGEERRGWLEETAGEGEEASTDRQTGEEEEEGFTRERMEREEGQVEGEEERTRGRRKVEEDGRGVEKEEPGDRRIDGGLEELYRQGGSVCVPLARLWSCCPKVQALSGTLQHLRDALLEDPRVRLTTDGTAVMLVDGEEGEDDEDLDWDYENKPARSGTGPLLVGSVESEDWEAEL